LREKLIAFSSELFAYCREPGIWFALSIAAVVLVKAQSIFSIANTLFTYFAILNASSTYQFAE